MAVATTGERIKCAMAMRGIKHQADIVRKSAYFSEKYGRTLSRNALSQYIHDLVEPKRDMIALIAEVLDVSDAWLLGYDVPMEREKPVPVERDGLDDLDRQILECLQKVTRDQKMMILAQLQIALKAQEAKQ